ncbi:aryl-sulfate sulfotransferase [candidate division KSB1 bacterium]
MNRLQSLILIWFLTSASVVFPAQSPIPAEGDTLNYIHILFQWEQEPETARYQLQVAVNDTTGGADPFESSLVTDVIDSTLLSIVTDSLTWGNDYVWRVRPIETDGDSGEWSGDNHFVTASLPDAIIPMEATIYDSTAYQPGLTFFDIMRSGYCLAVDMQGRPVWFLALDPVAYSGFKQPEMLPNGNLTAASSGGTSVRSAWELTIDGRIVWEDPKVAEADLEKIIKLDNGNYLGMGRYQKSGPIPEGPWEADFETAGLTSVPWQADQLVEYNPVGSVIWSWDSFDHYDFADYDSVSFAKAFKKEYHDWTHSNSHYYDPIGDDIYLCPRNLDRITKIDRSSGEIIWNMGRPMSSGEVTFGHDLGFSQQHAVKQLENGHLLLFDNGSRNTPQVSRVLEIEISETVSDTTASIVWEYVLPDSLYTSSNGSGHRLPNGNTLIACRNEGYVPDQGHLLEVDADQKRVWMTKLSAGAIYEANRATGLYPQAFSVIRPAFVSAVAEPSIFIPAGAAALEYELHNEGWLDETYDYLLTSRFGWFGGSGSVEVAAGESVVLSIDGTVVLDDYPDKIRLVVTPEQAPSRADTTILFVYSKPSSIAGETAGRPEKLTLRQNYPNPFNPETNITFELPDRWEVELRIYNIRGRLVKNLLRRKLEAGNHSVRWDGRDDLGKEVASGIYFYELRAGNHVMRKRMVLLK